MSDILGIGSFLSSLLSSGINASMQQQTNKQNMDIQRINWAREDNAVQRRVADLEAAGLNKVLAAGSAASSSGSPVYKSPQIADLGQAGLNAISSMRQKKDIAKTEADIALVDQQIAESQQRAEESRAKQGEAESRKAEIDYNLDASKAAKVRTSDHAPLIQYGTTAVNALKDLSAAYQESVTNPVKSGSSGGSDAVKESRRLTDPFEGGAK